MSLLADITLWAVKQAGMQAVGQLSWMRMRLGLVLAAAGRIHTLRRLACSMPSRGDAASTHPPLPSFPRRPSGLRALVFSGDRDGVVPTRSTRSWVESLDLPPAGDLRPWMDATTNEVRFALARTYGRAGGGEQPRPHVAPC